MSKSFNEYKTDRKYNRFEKGLMNLFKTQYTGFSKVNFFTTLFNAVINIAINHYYISGILWLITFLLHFDIVVKHVPFMRNNEHMDNIIVTAVMSVVSFFVFMIQIFTS